MSAIEPQDLAPRELEPRVTVPSAAPGHHVHFYEDEDKLSLAVARFLSEGLRAGEPVLVVAAPHRWELFRKPLERLGHDLDALASAGLLHVLDAGETLAEFMRNGEPRPELFDRAVGHLVSSLTASLPTRRLRAYGEMVDVLWKQGNHRGALRLEELWNELEARHPFELFCAYSMASFYKEPAGLRSVHARHASVIEENGAAIPAMDGNPKLVAERLRAEIAHREQVEWALRESLRELRMRDESLRRNQRAREGASVRAERLLKITAALADAVSAPEVYQALVDDLADALEASSAALWVVDEDGSCARLARARGYQETALRSFENLALDGSPGAPIVDCIRRAEPIWIPSQKAMLDLYPHLTPHATQERSYRVTCLPLTAHGRVLGAIGITIEEAREATEDERDFLLLVSRYAGQALERLRLFESERTVAVENSRLYQEMVESRSRAEQLYRFAQAVVAADRVEMVYDAAMGGIEAALGVRRAAILTYQDEDVMRFRAWRNLSETYRKAVEGHSPWPRDEAAPQPVLVPDALADPSLAPFASLLREERIGALAFIPLVTRGRLLGKFMLYYEHPHEFVSHEIDTALAIANHLASVITRFSVVARLEETIRSNELFAGALAHDLRNPLGAIVAAAQLVLMRNEGEPAAEERASKPLSRILSSGERMSAMIDQLLDFTRARSGGGIDVDPRDANLADLLAQGVGELELLHPEWKIVTRVRGDVSGSWDPQRLLQVISNLLTNAGQHTPSGKAVSVDADGTDRERVTLRIHNQGVIPEDLLPHLFDPFRSTRHRHDLSRGLGLGLFIVREIVRAHGGTVGVTSSEEEGTTFALELPRASGRLRTVRAT